jgi:hypothetical protein
MTANRKGRAASKTRKDILRFAPNFTAYVLPPDVVCLYSEELAVQEELAILGIEADHVGRKYIGGEVRRESQNVFAGLARNAAFAIGCHRVSTRILLPVQIASGARRNENKKVAGSIASPANEIVACRYTISKRRCLAPAAPAPRCTAT